MIGAMCSLRERMSVGRTMVFEVMSRIYLGPVSMTMGHFEDMSSVWKTFGGGGRGSLVSGDGIRGERLRLRRECSSCQDLQPSYQDPLSLHSASIAV